MLKNKGCKYFGALLKTFPLATFMTMFQRIQPCCFALLVIVWFSICISCGSFFGLLQSYASMKDALNVLCSLKILILFNLLQSLHTQHYVHVLLTFIVGHFCRNVAFNAL